MLNLGVNVDHVATVREARKGTSPSPLAAALACERAGAWGITAHLREDRRHICDQDMHELKARVKRLNFEMAVTDEMVAIASEIVPHSSCLVPEKREELTTEGGLLVSGRFDRIKEAIDALHAKNIIVSCFVDPDSDEIAASKEAGTDYIELHTGSYANATGAERAHELERLRAAAEYAGKLGIKVNAGHGIDYENIDGILTIPGLHELNIGHSIVSRSIMVGIEQAVREMIALMGRYSL